MDRNDWNPIRRLLALPNESRTKTLVMAFLVSAICAVAVSGATVYLRPIQAANRAAEEQARIESLVRGIPGMAALLEGAGGSLSTVIVDIETGRAANGVTADTLEAELSDAGNWTPLEPGTDIAGLGSRPNYLQIFLLRDGDEISLVLLPVTGQGYGGRIDAILALSGDMNTIAGIAVTGQSETPGLGGRIEEQTWQAGFSGKEIRDTTGEIRFAVSRGPATTEFEVDGITGATRTSNAVTRMIRFWLGPHGYEPLIRAIERGEF